MTIIRFEQALKAAIDFVQQHQTEIGQPVTLVRDLRGRISLALETTPPEAGLAQHQQLTLKFTQALQAYAPEQVFIYGDQLFAPGHIFASADKHRYQDSDIYVVDRQITNQDWLREPLHETMPARAVMFGIKGGVGRSTALAVWAWHLAQHGKKVLILDLDIESPGISRILLPDHYTPDFGIVDWFVEDAVGQGKEILPDMVSSSPLSGMGAGEIRVVPAAGRKENDYLAKLSRAYLELNRAGHAETFAQRLADLLGQLEQQEKPDIVLLDSRAGLHDLAAISITRLGASAFLFALNTPQTWQAYRFLFNHWQRWGQGLLPSFRDNLKVVAGMVPETGVADYLLRCRQSAYEVFSETLYEEDDGLDIDIFNFALDIQDAPHYPIPIQWHRAFLEFDPIPQSDMFNPQLVQAVYGEFMQQATALTLGEVL